MSSSISESALLPADERRARLEQFCNTLRDETFVGVPEVTAQQLRDKLDGGGGVVLVDVRTPEEQQVSMIPGPPGFVVTRAQFEADPGKWRGCQAVCSCTVGYRSGQYAQKLLTSSAVTDAGLSGAANLRGGILAYTQAGLPLVDPATGEATQRVHVYAPRWAFHGEGYTPVAFNRPLLSMLKEAVFNALGLGKAKPV
ncbi:hypothetical protein MNEG_10975 [Monoraphidium neglectum]|uniref:Rhodanese domain-containing protein n=1 Tax=Monoraphidium neglectum TaxID=145388 RepID=A0A0D2JB57_9CHLO|nr:hypothetical protein MNEG_10975 [Monoraphidium neglectum]KIY96987.1 hypothetical protein MNEG_10975 [Monoraphidium neglectum]|eukprot:XP_013896007.1 hypothetical protein MNEG_10975 [Monoraphidium neglectum]